MERKNLGIKAKGFAGGMLTGFIFSLLCSLVFTYLLFSQKFHFVLFLMVIGYWFLTGFCLTLFIKQIKKPKIILQYDDFGIYFYEKKEEQFISYSSIVSVRGVCSSGKKVEYKFGDIHIETTDGKKYKIGVMYDVKDVEKTLLDKIG